MIEKYLYRLLQQTRVVVCSGNHDLDSRNAAGEAAAGWLYDAKAANLFLDGTSVELSGALLTICPWWDGAVSRAEVEAELALPAGMIKDLGSGFIMRRRPVQQFVGTAENLWVMNSCANRLYASVQTSC